MVSQMEGQIEGWRGKCEKQKQVNKNMKVHVGILEGQIREWKELMEGAEKERQKKTDSDYVKDIRIGELNSEVSLYQKTIQMVMQSMDDQ